MDPTTVLGDTSKKGILRRILDLAAGILPWGIGALGLTYLFDSAGGEDSLLKKLEDIPLIGSIVKFISDAASGVGNWFSGLFAGKEGTTMNKAIAERISADSSFAVAEKALGIAGIGEELRSITLESTKNGGEAKATGKALHKKYVAHIVDKWQDVNPKGDPTNITEQADKVATGLVGIPDQENLPREIDQGIAGLLWQANEAKKAEGDLTMDQVNPIKLSPELQALVAEASTPNATPSQDSEVSEPVAPTKMSKLAALAAAGK